MPEHETSKRKESTADDMIAAIGWASQKRQSILVIITILVLGGVLYAYLRTQETEAEQQAWQEFYAASLTNVNNPVGQADALEAAAEEVRSRAVFYAYMREMAVRGKIYAKPDQLKKAVAAGELFIQKFPNQPFTPQVRLDMGVCLFNLGEYAQAREQFDQVIASNTPYLNTNARFYKAQTLAREGKTDKAITLYSELSKLDTDPSSQRIGSLSLYAKTLLVQSKKGPIPEPTSSLIEPIPTPSTLERLKRAVPAVPDVSIIKDPAADKETPATETPAEEETPAAVDETTEAPAEPVAVDESEVTDETDESE